MRTTISVDDHLLRRAKRAARAAGVTLGGLIERALLRELGRSPGEAAEDVPTYRGRGGLRPGIDPTSNRSMNEAIDRGAPIEKLR